jgi:Amt family ammonium transporter
MQIIAHVPVRRVLAMAWTAAVLTAVGLVAALRHPDTGWLGPASLMAALVAWVFMILLPMRLRSAMVHNAEGYASLFERHPQPIIVADNATLDVVAANRAASKKYGYSQEEFAGLSVVDLYHPDDREEIRRSWADKGEAARRARLVARFVAKDGTPFAAEVLSTTLELHARRVRMAVVTDVTDRDDARADTLQSGVRYRQLVDTAKEGIIALDTSMAISAVNQQAANMLGYSEDELVGHRLSEFAATDGAAAARAEAVQQTGARLSGERETTLRRKDGTVVTVLLNESSLLDRDGRHAGQLGMITDLTERKGFEDELAFRASHDPLTGLPNRLLLVDQLRATLNRAKPGEANVTVVSVDVDGFRDVNDAAGHGGGDQLLIQIAERLSRNIGEAGIVARFGVDEFVVIAEGTPAVGPRLADRVRAVVTAPYSISGTTMAITASIGVAVGRYGDRAGDLLRDADMALLQAKADGGDRTSMFSEALRASSRQRLALVSDLRHAVERHEFSLRFQPVMSLLDETIIGAEALVRWEHPSRGTVGPVEFIPIAEETGLIGPIGQWVIEETCRHFAEWQRLVPDLFMSLNISARQLAGGSLDHLVREVIASSGVDPSRLALEITEGVLMDDVKISVDNLTALRRTGVAISIDDFGTGYSSLAYLDKFPIDVLKIDRSFVAGLPDNEYDVALVSAVLAIAETLGFSVIAEGIENASQAEMLVSLGCTKGQGYLYSHPLPADEFQAMLLGARVDVERGRPFEAAAAGAVERNASDRPPPTHT